MMHICLSELLYQSIFTSSIGKRLFYIYQKRSTGPGFAACHELPSYSGQFLSCAALQMQLQSCLQMLISVDPVIMPEQERFHHRSQLHIEVEEINSECYSEQPCAEQEQVEADSQSPSLHPSPALTAFLFYLLFYASFHTGLASHYLSQSSLLRYCKQYSCQFSRFSYQEFSSSRISRVGSRGSSCITVLIY